MSHAVVEDEHTRSTTTQHKRSKGKAPKNREQDQLHSLVAAIQALYFSSQFGQSLSRTLLSAVRSSQTPITKLVSLGIGSLSSTTKGQTRRLKQLAILLAIRDELQLLSGTEVKVFAQDPVFTKQDEAFLSSLNIRILRTTSGSSLSEAASLISSSTLVYSPFLTLEAYEALFAAEPLQLQLFVGDDFNALKEKWPKHSYERVQVERLVRGAVHRYRRRVVQGEGFWEEVDQSFPLAIYVVERRGRERAHI